MSIKKISKSFSTNNVLREIYFSLYKGEVRALVGENGAGKSTLIKIIAGALKPDDGLMFLEDKQIELTSPKNGIDAGIAVIYQELDLLPELSVLENIFLGIEIKNKRNFLDVQEMGKIIDKNFSEMNIEINKFANVGSLPIASKQMVAIAKAIVHNAKILIMDEPSSSLTSKELEILFKEIRRLKEKRVSVIYISHRLEEIFQICDSVTVLRDGVLISTEDVSNVNRKMIIEMMIGKKINENRLNDRQNFDNSPIIEIKDLSYRDILDSVSFTVRKGEIFGILGLIGSGTIELGKIIYGIINQTSGTISSNGNILEFKTPNDALENSISYVPDDRREFGIFMELDVEKNAVITSLNKFLSKNIFQLIDQKSLTDSFTKHVNLLGIKITGRNQQTQFLSGGNQQKILVARTLIRDSDIIILSSPTKGIDVGSKYEIYQILLSCATQGKTVIAISQEIPELVQICDRILLLKRGKAYREYTGPDINESLIYNDLMDE
ncbi:MAG: sugar ABC transporter ATP-binding protein [Flexilinea sp.]